MITMIYGLMVFVAVAFAWASENEGLRKIAAWVSLDWIIGNFCFEAFGAADPWVSPILGAFVAAMIAGQGIKFHSRTAWAVVATFALQETVVVSAFLSGTEGDTLYHGLLNALLIGRLVLVGGVGLYVMARGPALGDLRVAHNAHRRSGHSPPAR